MKRKNQTRGRSRLLQTACLTMNAIFLMFLIPCTYPQPGIRHGNIHSGDEPVLLRQEEGIELYEQWINSHDNQELRQLIMEFSIAGNIETAIGLIGDEKLAEEWMSSIKTFQVLAKESPDCWYTYILYDIPWPLKKQDLVVRNTLSRGPDGKSAWIEMEAVAAYLPDKKGVSRIKHMKGRWYLTSEEDNMTRIQYSVFSVQRSKFPKWLTDPIIQQNLVKSMKDFKGLAEKQYSCLELTTKNEYISSKWKDN